MYREKDISNPKLLFITPSTEWSHVLISSSYCRRPCKRITLPVLLCSRTNYHDSPNQPSSLSPEYQQ